MENDIPILAPDGYKERAHFFVVPSDVWRFLTDKQMAETRGLLCVVGSVSILNLTHFCSLEKGIGQHETLSCARRILQAMGRDFPLAKTAYLPVTRGIANWSGLLHVAWFDRIEDDTQARYSWE